jgi:Ca2+-transporting ATPase
MPKTNTSQHVPYQQSVEEVLRILGSHRAGIATSEAKRRLEQYGENRLVEVNKESYLRKYLRQFRDTIILLLLVSAALSLYLGDIRTAVVLGFLVLFNTAIGFAQEFKAERIMESLEKLVVPTAKVVRGGIVEEVAASELVPGEIVYIEEGDAVPADLRVIDEYELSTNDFALTGESNPSRKFTHAISGTVPLGNRGNLVFLGTTVATGHAYGAVVATGMETELGRIANLSESTPNELSPLQKEMNHIAGRVTVGTLVLCLILLPIAIAANLGIKDAFLFAIGFASSIIPQGLPAEINTALAQAAGRLVRARALVKKLSAVETLGATSVICTDKTGTLTKNEMTVDELMAGSTVYAVTETGYEPKGEIRKDGKRVSPRELADLQRFFATGVYASNASVHEPDEEHPTWYCVGDPTEGALITLARKVGLKPPELERVSPELKEFTFDSARKLMSSIRKIDGQLYVFVKGAPEEVLKRCTSWRVAGEDKPLQKSQTAAIQQYNLERAEQAKRNLGFAYRKLSKDENVASMKMADAEQNLVWLGMVSMMDPLREEVPAAFAEARRAHIKISIITGDFAPTAKAIAIKAGLATKPSQLAIVLGDELDALSDEQILQYIERGGCIFSRVSPEHKLRIVSLVKEHGHVVAVTGDGINDAPALKRADIGVAMGKTGTDVAKQSSEIILLDDSFHTLVGAVKEGRVIYQNIHKGALSCFTSNAAELVVNLTSLACATLLGIPLAISVMLILAIDLIAELFPIAALGWDRGNGHLLDEAPRDVHDHILSRWNILDLLWCGIIIGGLAYANYLGVISRAGSEASGLVSGSGIHLHAAAMTYLTIVLCQLGNILQRRTPDGLFSRYQLHNRVLWGSMLLSLTCVITIIYSPLNTYFGAGPLSLVDWGFATAAAALFLFIREIQRVLAGRKVHKRMVLSQKRVRAT